MRDYNRKVKLGFTFGHIEPKDLEEDDNVELWKRDNLVYNMR